MRKKRTKNLQINRETLRQIRGGDTHPWPDPPPRIGESLATCPDKSTCWPPP